MAESTYYEFKIDDRVNQVKVKGRPTLVCPVCSCSYRYEFSLRRHFLRSHVNRAYLKPADVVSIGVNVQEHHKLTGDQPKMYSCNVCCTLFEKEQYLCQHVRSKHQVYEYTDVLNETIAHKCSECEAEFSQRRNLMCHMRRHKAPVLKKLANSSQVSQPSSPEDPNETSQSPSTTDTIMSRQLRERKGNYYQAVFTCTICKKLFETYGNMLRHRRLTHETQLKKPVIRTKFKKRGKSTFTNPIVARKFYNSVASNIAFNIKNCIHGNAEHLSQTALYIHDYEELNSRNAEIRKNTLNQKTLSAFNIKTISCHKLKTKSEATQDLTTCDMVSANGKELLSLGPLTIQTEFDSSKCFSEQCRSPDVYDKPGLWKFVCMVCLQEFPNTLDLFTHQDTQHIGVKTTYMEVGKEHSLPHTDVSSHQGVLGIVQESPLVVQPIKFTCTKCKAKFYNSSSIHNHLVSCGESLLKQLQKSESSDKLDYKMAGKEIKQKGNQNPVKEIKQVKLTDMPGFNSKKKRSQFEDNQILKPKKSAENAQSSNFMSNPDVLPEKRSGVFRCRFCSVTFKYAKVYSRHVKTNCEMRKIATSSAKIAEQKDKINLDKLFDLTSSSQMSRTQARVLAKFIHPARVCGPCFACKRPNQARRYTHLQQRSQPFVDFVMAKDKDITVHSCLCKACESSYRKDYEKIKNKCKQKTDGRRKRNHRKQTHVRKIFAHSGIRSPTIRAASTVVKKALCNSKRNTRTSISCDSLLKQPVITKHSSAKKMEHVSTTKSVQNDGSSTANKDEQRGTKRQSRVLQSRSLPDTVTDGHPMKKRPRKAKSDVLICSEASKYLGKLSPLDTNPKVVNKKTDDPIIMSPISALLKNASDVASSTSEHSNDENRKLRKRRFDALEQRSPVKSSRWHQSIDLPSNGRVIGKDSSPLLEESDARLQVVLQFVKSSPPTSNHVSSRKSSLTEIIDAVSRRVREEPELAKSLIDAISAAARNEEPASVSSSLKKTKDSKNSGASGNVKAISSDSAAQEEIKVWPIKLQKQMPSLVQKTNKSSTSSQPDYGKVYIPSFSENPSQSSIPADVITQSTFAVKTFQSPPPVVQKLKKKMVMSDSSYQHMCGIIDAVAAGKIGGYLPTIETSIEDSCTTLPFSMENLAHQRSDSPSVSSGGSDGLDMSDLESLSSRASTHSSKNLRLASIIKKLSKCKKDSCQTNEKLNNDHTNDSGYVGTPTDDGEYPPSLHSYSLE